MMKVLLPIAASLVLFACGRTAPVDMGGPYAYTAPPDSEAKVKLFGISGIAPVERGTYLLVNDLKNRGKSAGLPRFFLTDKNPERRPAPINMKGVIANDLEGLTAIPGKRGEFIALQSNGCMLHAVVHGPNSGQNRLRQAGTLPVCEGYTPGQSHRSARECEAIALHPLGETLLLVWATRGHENEASRILWSRVSYQELVKNDACDSNSPRKFDTRYAWKTFRADEFIQRVQSHKSHRKLIKKTERKIRAGCKPAGETYFRNVSDLTLDPAGHLYATSAYDPGDCGPFSGALTRVGRFEADTLKPESSPAVMGYLPPGRRPCRKYEALTLSPYTGRFVLGSDDEYFGGCLRFQRANEAYLTSGNGR